MKDVNAIDYWYQKYLKEKLTWENIEKIHSFLYAVKNNKDGNFTFTRLSKEQYEEVLQRFNELRKK